MIHVWAEACDTSAFGLSKKPHNLLRSLYYVGQSCVFMHVLLCWAHWTAVRQAAGERWVKSNRETSIMDGVTHLRRKTDRRRAGERRQQTHSYTAEIWPCWEVGVIAVKPSQARPSAHESSQPRGGKRGYDATYDKGADNKCSHFPDTSVISCSQTPHWQSMSTHCRRLIILDPLVPYGVSG